ncbi:glycosyltransferase family A protein [Aminobacter sp. AP02]|uniref:glycosyltransferase family 2 protein n=1 Tax=Aminobacter sp. AP02 TaxID=2135737 RepID=UPI000D7B51BB|nr:glycosyltransferase family A protein [Aminobacter sp. AP02]PWK64098.1 glycosyl transferase family 2 [Aminobacter sp. AP02]
MNDFEGKASRGDSEVEHPATDFSIGGRSIAQLSDNAIKPPLVSFVVICWNYAQFVGAAIDSIKKQDYPHFECLVINNGSTDDSAEVIASHVEGDSRFAVATLSENLGQLGAAFWALDKIRGGFVTFVDADDVLFANFASMHVQAHLALPHSVAFTSSSVAEVDTFGNALTAAGACVDISDANLARGLRAADATLRVPSVAPTDFDVLSARTAILPRPVFGWHWGPGTANMYRASILRLVRREGTHMRSADGYFNFMCNAFAGSALIDVIASGYRLHGANYFSARERSAWLVSGGPAYNLKAAQATLTDIEFLLANVGKYAWMLNGTFWQVLDQVTREAPRHLRRFYRDPPLFEMFLAHAPQLAAEFPERVFCREILARFSGSQARNILRRGLGGELNARAYGEIALAHLRRALLGLRKRKSRRPRTGIVW